MSLWQRVGFTGTERGLSDRQRDGLRSVLATSRELHHGDCIGGDAEADAIARQSGLHVVVHPPTSDRKRAWCWQPTTDGLFVPAPYLVRIEPVGARGDFGRTIFRCATCSRRIERCIRPGAWERHVASMHNYGGGPMPVDDAHYYWRHCATRPYRPLGEGR